MDVGDEAASFPENPVQDSEDYEPSDMVDLSDLMKGILLSFPGGGDKSCVWDYFLKVQIFPDIRLDEKPTDLRTAEKEAPENFEEKLREWLLLHQVPYRAMDKLLVILRVSSAALFISPYIRSRPG